MYNTCYGGFTLSDAVIDEYKRRCPDGKNPRLFELDRDDQAMAQIVKDMGSAANGRFSDIRLQRIPAEYRDYYTIHEYDGLESVLLNHNVYQLEAVKSLIKGRTLSRADKLARIAAVISQEEQELSQTWSI
jgi:hypothetical protein